MDVYAPMTLPEACAILNERKHGGRHNWTTTGNSGLISREKFGPTLLPSAFEAIAIAEKYERGAVLEELASEAEGSLAEAREHGEAEAIPYLESLCRSIREALTP